METLNLKNFKCRACESEELSLVLNLGIQPLANNLLRHEDLYKAEPKYPLRQVVCNHCHMVQIVDTIPPTILFEEYLYFSSYSDTMLAHAKKCTQRYQEEMGLNSQSFVVEIASNDGYLLKNFVAQGIPVLGVEPAHNIAKVARQIGVETTEKFFGCQTAEEIVTQKGKADLILGNNVLAHAPDIHDFIKGIQILIKDQGRCVIEFPYLVDLVEKLEFDTIYHEHVYYFSLFALKGVYEANGLEVNRCERVAIHGGSLRVFTSKKGAHPVEKSVEEILKLEEKIGVNTIDYYADFSKRVGELKEKTVQFIRNLRAEGKRVAAYGASAKSTTLLNFYGLGSGEIDFIVDRSPHKQNKFTPGTHIPIFSVDKLLKSQPDYTLLLTWNFAEEILLQQKEYSNKGGKFIIPVPDIKVV